MPTREQQIELAKELKDLTDEFCRVDDLINVALKEYNHSAIRKLYLQKLEIKEKMDIVRDKLLKEDNMGVTRV
jgi:hypothetical protein